MVNKNYRAARLNFCRNSSQKNRQILNDELYRNNKVKIKKI